MEQLPDISDRRVVLEELPYTYDRLPRGETFRYLILEPREDQEVLRCSLRTTTIADADYEAISYVWGTEIRDHEIICDGHKLKITKNLHDALTTLRTSTARSLWADSICIDQQNLDEKTHQVACMGRIYAAARCVLIYMGPDTTGHASKVSSLLSDLCQRFDDELTQVEKLTWNLISYPSPDDPYLTDGRWGSLRTFFHLPWFQRGWVVREAGLARECEVIWGSSQFSWTDLMWVVCWLRGKDVVIAALPSSYFFRNIHWDAYWGRHNDLARVFFEESPWVPNRLLDYLMQAVTLHFRDRRDSIFAFLDLAASEDVHLSLNYDQAPHKVFRDFTEQYLHMTGDITILEYVAHGDRITQSGLPTWVPNWDVMQESASPVANYLGSWQPLISGIMPKHGTFRRPEITNDELLKVHGAIYDTVEDLMDTLRSSTTTPQVVYNLWRRTRTHPSIVAYPAEWFARVFIATLTNYCFRGEKQDWDLGVNAYVHKLLHPTLQAGIFQWTEECEHWSQLHLVHRELQEGSDGMRLMITKSGSIGLAPSAAREGDIWGIVYGCIFPCILRASQSDYSYQFIGSAHVAYYSSEEGVINGVQDDGKHDLRLRAYRLAQWRDKVRIRWDVEEQDIYLR